jgi:AcrR family transcriptional regulator
MPTAQPRLPTRRPAPKRTPAAASAAAEQARTPLTPENWIEAATTLLEDQGIDCVRVDVLARLLGVTRGSFYWHFKDRQDLLRCLLQAWHQRATEQVTARFEGGPADPQALVRDLISLPARGRSAQRAARIELAIRAWARRDEMARQALDEADASRIAYHAQVFSALGFPIAEARMRAFVLYGHEVAESLLLRQGTASQRQERSAFIERLIQQPLTA